MEIPKVYNWKNYEDSIYQKWEDSGFFQPEAGQPTADNPEQRLIDDRETFTIMLPPPNATGTLHLGHAMYVIQDIMIRHARMSGKKTLWLPGTDHAAIATQSKVESIIFEQTGKTRHDIGRVELVKLIEAFVEESKATINNQLRKMGFSLDWSRERFTLDPKLVDAVQTMFMNMAKDGLVYRGDRIVNWDPQLQTTVANDEMEYKEETSPFYYFQYGPFEIGTSRPETKFGDKYVVMHPDDERYSAYKHGQTINLEWINGPITATIIKDQAADPEFGSGAMTITPWHDITDFEIAERHNLEREQIIDLEGKLLPIAGEFSGMPIQEARSKIVEKLKNKGLLTRVDENYVHNVNVNYRGAGLIEPQIMKQWFVAVDKPVVEWKGKKLSLKDIAIDVVRNGDINIVPNKFNKTYFQWIENLHDWCISRQLWYGHRIPAWYQENDVEGMNPVVQIESPGPGYYQDEDVLDTWFSSGMWTFSTLNWPDDFDFKKRQAKPGTDLATYHPTQVLETGYDILFFWVARMILMTTYGMGEVPFETVYLHGLVRDRAGAKMSKSKDNGIDPLVMSSKYGTDAVRLSLIIGTSPGNDQRLFEEKIAGYRNFVNKIWNVSRYVITTEEDDSGRSNKSATSTTHSLADKWIQSRLNSMIELVNHDFENHQYSAAAERTYDFLWHDFADWYIEIKKFQPNPALMNTTLQAALKLLHPFVPFITEAIWENLDSSEELMIAPWPMADQALVDKKLVKQFEAVQDIVTQVRNLRGQYNLSYSKSFTLHTAESVVAEEKMIIEKMCKVIIVFDPATGATTELTNSIFTFAVELGEVIDVAAERKRLQKEITQLEKYVSGLEKKLANEKYTTNAPAEVIEQDKQKLMEKQEALQTLQQSIDNFV